jgi:hypothetical protein
MTSCPRRRCCLTASLDGFEHARMGGIKGLDMAIVLRSSGGFSSSCEGECPLSHGGSSRKLKGRGEGRHKTLERWESPSFLTWLEGDLFGFPVILEKAGGIA